MKKLICILASAALLGACEQKTEVAAPAPAPAPEKPDAGATGQKPKRETGNTLSKAGTPATTAETKAESAVDAVPAASTETKTESTETSTITLSTPNP